MISVLFQTISFQVITDQFIDDAAHGGGGVLVYATPPTTPSPSMGSRKSSMCSIASISSSTSMSQPLSPSRSSTTSSLRRHASQRWIDISTLIKNHPRIRSLKMEILLLFLLFLSWIDISTLMEKHSRVQNLLKKN